MVLAEITCSCGSAGLSLDGASEIQETPRSLTVILASVGRSNFLWHETSLGKI